MYTLSDEAFFADFLADLCELLGSLPSLYTVRRISRVKSARAAAPTATSISMTPGMNPSAEPVMRYFAGGTSVKRYSPSLLDVVLRVISVTTSIKLTSAFGTAAPLSSTTRPTIVPVAVCDPLEALHANATVSRKPAKK